jgi:restriction system protein
MAIPTYDELMLPVLKLSALRTWPMRELIGRICDDLGLTEQERAETIPSGGEPLISSRVHWAKTYLKQAGLVEQPKRAFVQASDAGRKVLAANPVKIDSQFLRQFPEFMAFLSRTKSQSGAATDLEATPAAVSSTPEEQIAAASLELDEALRDTLLARILEAPPAFFERLIVDLLLAIGYGGSRADAGERLGGTGDGGVDGVIREDQLGLDRIYLQAKRYRPGSTIGSETVQAFIGALIGKGAQKGVLITTSSFSRQAVAVAAQSGQLRIILIDGGELTKLMTRFNVGVRVARTVEIKRIDLDYFEEGETD